MLMSSTWWWMLARLMEAGSIWDSLDDPRVMLVLEPDSGPADGLNKGVAATKGAIVGYLNADDLYLANALCEVEGLFRRMPSIDVAYGDGWIIDGEGRVVRHFESSPWGLRRYLHGGVSVLQQSTFFRREAFDRTAGVQPRECDLLGWRAARRHGAGRGEVPARAVGLVRVPSASGGYLRVRETGGPLPAGPAALRRACNGPQAAFHGPHERAVGALRQVAALAGIRCPPPSIRVRRGGSVRVRERWLRNQCGLRPHHEDCDPLDPIERLPQCIAWSARCEAQRRVVRRT